MAVVGAVVSAIATVAGTISSMKSAKKARKASAAAARETREARSITEASQLNVNRINRRRALREERVRRAKIIQAGAAGGVLGSSGVISAPGIIGTNVAAAIAAQTSGTKAAQGISARLQTAADLTGQAAAATAQGQLFSNIGTAVGDIVSELDIFKTKIGG